MKQEIIDALRAIDPVNENWPMSFEDIAGRILAVVEQRAMRPGASLEEVVNHMRYKQDLIKSVYAFAARTTK